MSADKLNLFTIYERPRDFPTQFVVRRFENGSPTADIWLADSLENARAILPRGLYRIKRVPEDDPVIVETWL